MEIEITNDFSADLNAIATLNHCCCHKFQTLVIFKVTYRPSSLGLPALPGKWTLSLAFALGPNCPGPDAEITEPLYNQTNEEFCSKTKLSFITTILMHSVTGHVNKCLLVR